MEAEPTATLVAPAPSHIIERPRLTDLLAESGARVILLVAPAGYGKTTLARQWAARQPGPVAWYRTTRASGDVAALAVGLDNVLSGAAPLVSRDPKRIASVAAANSSVAPLARALTSIYSGLTRDVLLVVDDYESAGTVEADELLAWLVEELDIRFLVTSRNRPSWFSARLPTYGEGLEIGTADLEMTDAEARAVLARDPTPRDPQPLLETAQGWPAVIGLAAMRAAEALPTPGMSAHLLYDFLAAELLDSTASDVREGLTLAAAASIGDVSTAALVLGDATSSILEDARRRGLAQIEDDGTLSLHPLFHELLVDRLATSDEARTRRLVERLRPLIDARCWDEALAASEAVPEHAFVTAALRRALPELVRAGRVATLRRWSTVGRSSGADEGLVAYADAELALRDADFDRAIALGERAAMLLNGDSAARAHLVAGRAANLGDRSERARRRFGDAKRLAASRETRSAAIWGEFTQAVDDELDEAAELLREFEAGHTDGVEHSIRAADGHIRLGLLGERLADSVEDVEPTIVLLDSAADPMPCSSLLNSYSTALSALGRYEESVTAAERELAIAADYELEFVRRHALINRARALIGLRQIARAERNLQSLEATLRPERDTFLAANVVIERARLCVTTGDLDRAASLLFLDPDRRLNRSTRGEYLALRALVLGGLGEQRQAETCAARAVEASRAAQARALSAIACCLATTASTERVDAGIIFDQFTREGSRDAIVLGCRASHAFAQQLIADDCRRERLASILVRSNDSALARRIGLDIPRFARPPTALSPRELEIHELIAQGRTNREIAATLYISESTTKLHVRHILEKLGVRSRVEAARIWQTPDEPDAST
jgi:ATP/maltotriose-dependent transcriptional regulator MalT